MQLYLERRSRAFKRYHRIRLVDLGSPDTDQCPGQGCVCYQWNVCVCVCREFVTLGSCLIDLIRTRCKIYTMLTKVQCNGFFFLNIFV